MDIKDQDRFGLRSSLLQKEGRRTHGSVCSPIKLITPLMFVAKPHLLEAITGKASNTPRSNNDGLQGKSSTVTQHWVHDDDNTWRRAQFEGFEGALHILYCPELRKEFTVPPSRHIISKPNSQSAPSKHSA